jgi:hypothetical protein
MLNINLGYDYRISGDLLTEYCQKNKINMRSKLLESSFDVNVCPSLFCQEGLQSAPYEIGIKEILFDNAHFKTFDLFKTDLEALSFYAQPMENASCSFCFYEAIFLASPNDEVLSSWVKAISFDQASSPEGLAFRSIGFELMDETFTSVTHLYYDLSAIKEISISPENLEKIQKKMNNNELFLVQVFKAADNWWFRANNHSVF